MGWVKLDDQFSRHPKVLQAGPLSGWLHVCALNYCAQYLTDGFIPKSAVNGLADFTHEDIGQSSYVGMDFVPALLKSGMWIEVDGGYQIHDYLDYNPSREDVQKKRQADLERKRNSDSPAMDSARNRNGIHAESKRPVPRPLPVPQEDEPRAKALSSAGRRQPTRDPRVDEIYEHFKARIQPRSRTCPRKKIAARLKRFTVIELREGIDHFAEDPWWMEHNAARGAEWFFESDQHAEQFLLLRPRQKIVQMRPSRVDQSDLDELSPGETA